MCLARRLGLTVLFVFIAACSRPPGIFSDQNARVHVELLANKIGSRPAGTPANAQARAYIVDALRLYGFDVRVQETDARRPELGRTARVSNIIAVRRGSRDEAVGLLSHYDSAPEAPGGADDGFGVAVSLEAARVLAARSDRHWSLMILVTDGEEAGLMGAAGLMTDPEVRRRLKTYINLEAIGSDSPVMLFETGPGNSWLVDTWARHAPHPRGGSFGLEIYKRLPNDTDFSILKRQDIPGLNLAAVGDSYGYHTARDTADRVTTRSLRETGENLVALVAALDGQDISARSEIDPTFFDVSGRAALSYGPVAGYALGAAALIAGVIAWVRVTAAAFAMGGVGRWVLTALWTILGATLVIGSMIGTTWALRAAREVYHPWYARPDRLFILLLCVGAAVGWSVTRIGHFLPARAHGLRHPVVTWSMALPAWILLGSLSFWLAPGAAYLWLVPLFLAGLLLSAIPPSSVIAVRVASAAVLAVCAILWARTSVDLLAFLVALFGRFPIITPIFVYAAVLAVAAVMLLPPFVALTARKRPLLRPTLTTAVLLLAVAAAVGFAYTAPAYTYEQPLRRRIRVLQPPNNSASIWEVASIEPGIDLETGAPSSWQPAVGPPSGMPVAGMLPHPFVFRTTGPPIGDPPAAISGFGTAPLPDGIELTVTVVPREPGLSVSFILPAGVSPARANLPGLDRLGRWTAAFAAPPAEGVTFRASFRGVTPEVLRDTLIGVTSFSVPGGTGWQRLPAWIPQERMVWTATTTWQVRADVSALAPVPPLR